MIMEMIRAFGIIAMAEMGDKTQLLSMSFATQYSVRKVLLGIAIGSALNHGLAIAFGTILSMYIDLNNLQILGGAMFLLFGYWGLRIDKDEDDDDSSERFGPVLTVATAFFIGELGDKTQLAAMTISTYSNYPVFVLLGTVLGMIATGGIGIFVGYKLGGKIPELYIKLASSTIFMAFGISKLYGFLPQNLLRLQYVLPFLAIVLGTAIYMGWKLVHSDLDTRYRGVAEKLREQNIQLKKSIESICKNSKNCNEKSCAIGFIKKVLDSDEIIQSDMNFEDQELDKDKLIDAMSRTLYYYFSNIEENIQNEKLNLTKGALEKEIFGAVVQGELELDEYIRQVKKKSPAEAIAVENKLKSYGLF